MNKLLVLYPIDENMILIRKNSSTYDCFNETIDKRYREKGYQINYLTFKDKQISDKLKQEDTDKILNVDMSFNEHTTSIGEDENGKDVYQYPSNEQIDELLGYTDEIVICGFHIDDCIMRVAEYFYNKGTNTLVDEELTDFFRTRYNRFYFDPEKYNLANILTYNIAEEMVEFGTPVVSNTNSYKERYIKPWMHLERFKPDFTMKEAISEIEKNEQEL